MSYCGLVDTRISASEKNLPVLNAKTLIRIVVFPKNIIYITQPNLTLFYFIFTYLWHRSLWSFRHYGSNVALYHFFSYKPTKGTSDFILNYLKKDIGGTTTQKNLKTNTKTMVSFIWMCPQEPQGRGANRSAIIH